MGIDPSPDVAVTTPAGTGSGLWRFGDVRFDEHGMALTVRGVTASAPMKSLEVLRELLHHAGEVVTKDELAEKCWPRRILSESVLTTTIGRLRRALGDADRAAVQAVKGLGYRLAVPVTFEGPEPPPAPRLTLRAGDCPPGRPDWRLAEPIGVGGQADLWLGRNGDNEPRTFKFALDLRAVEALKRELAISRLLSEVSGDAARAGFVSVIEGQFEQLPAFVASEWICGGNLEAWATARGGIQTLPLDVRLELVAQCAESLAIAHGAGVLHKDLKPANVLIDDSGPAPRIRLADFGSATVMDRERLRRYAMTQMGLTQAAEKVGSSSGTPLYMAPEVLAGQASTERSDLYALGMLLYQLVVGDFRRPLAAGWESEVADELLREDIALTAVGDPMRRLGDAAELARRLRSLPGRREQRALEQREAQRADVLERQLKRHRERRPWVIAVGAMLILGLIVVSLLGWQLKQALDTAKRENAVSIALNEFLRNDVLGAAPSEHSGKQDPTVREVMRLAQERISTQLAGRPLEQGVIRTTLGWVWLQLANQEDAVKQLQLAIEELENAGQGQTLYAAEAHYWLAYANRALAPKGDAQMAQIERILAALDGKDTLAHRRLDARVRLARSLKLGWDGQEDQALDQLRSLLRDIAQHLPENDEIRTLVTNELSHMLVGAAASTGSGTAAASEALQLLQPAVADTERVFGPLHPETLRQRRLLANAYSALGRGDEAIAELEPLVQRYALAVGPEAAPTLHARKNLARDIGRFRDPTQGIAQLREVRDRLISLYGGVASSAIDAEIMLVELELELGRWEDAVIDGTLCLERFRRDMPEDARVGGWTGFAASRLGYALAHLGRHEEAWPLLELAQNGWPGDPRQKNAAARLYRKRYAEVHDAVFGTAKTAGTARPAP